MQQALGAAQPSPWREPEPPLTFGGCFVCFQRGAQGPGTSEDRGWAGAVLVRSGGLSAAVVAEGRAGAPYKPGLLALREGPLLEAAVRQLPRPPDVLLVNATGRDHPRRAGLALHLGARVGIPTVGVTHRPLAAQGPAPGPERGATSPLVLDGEVVGFWVRTRAEARPIAAHAAWRTDPATAAGIVLAALGRGRTPEPIARAREAARTARAQATEPTG